MQQYGYWKRQRGIANSKRLEQALFVYKAKLPRMMPKTRMFVDPWSSLFNQVVRNTPVLAPRHQALVFREVRQTSLNSMVGVPNIEDDVEAEKQNQVEDDDEFDRLHQPDGPDPEDRGIVAAPCQEEKAVQATHGN